MTEQEIERGSLADAFKGSAGPRTAGLGDILGHSTGRSATAKTAPAKASPAKAPERAPVAFSEAQEPAAAAPGTSVAPGPAAAVSAPLADPNKVENVPAYIEPDVLAAVRVAKRKGVPAGQPETTYDELLLDAIDDLGADRIREAFNPTAAEGAGLVSRRPRRARGTGGVQIQLRLSKGQQAQLQLLMDDVGAPSRSAFVSMVFRLAYVDQIVNAAPFSPQIHTA
ncbi:MAG: hypothetical protein JF592_18495 [Microbacterium sp.]|uniref:hypothetical protein n=1 Tax=Microbacterium sp. TaxID=51671 RepID=UPI001E158549|nr:hypothetical protein [Microbacterium sp.]MBW8764539.1 hypothetical protein [Microbacterium sp.]